MTHFELPEKCNVKNIDTWLEHTTLYIRIIPGEEWKLYKAGEHYIISCVKPASKSEEFSSTSLLEVLLHFTLRNGKYDHLADTSNLNDARKQRRLPAKTPLKPTQENVIPFRTNEGGSEVQS